MQPTFLQFITVLSMVSFVACMIIITVSFKQTVDNTNDLMNTMRQTSLHASDLIKTTKNLITSDKFYFTVDK